MPLDDLVLDTFLRFDANATVADARAVVDGERHAGASHAIVVREAGNERVWYLFPLAPVRDRFSARDPAQTVGEALDLDEWAATSAVERDADPSIVDDLAVVLAGGEVVGFVDRRYLAALRDGETGGPGAEPESLGPRAGTDRVRRGGHRGSSLAPQPPPAADDDATAGSERSVEATFPESVEVDAIEWLLVSIVNAAPTAHGLGIDVAAGDSVDILVQARRGFRVIDDAKGTIEVPASGESLPLQFKLQAVDKGAGLIRVVVFHSGEPLGSIELEPTVTAAAATGRARGRTPMKEGRKAVAALVAASPQVPDLSMFIDEHELAGTLEFTIRLTATDPALDLNLRPFGPFRLEVDPAVFFESFFQEIEDLPIETAEQRTVAERRLAAKGSYLSEALLPPDLRDTLWALRDKITSIIVQSEEPWIPWELCRLQGREDGRVVEGPFLCEAFAMTRWLPGLGFKRPLRLTNLALLVPADSGLPLAAAEREYVLSLAADGRAVTAIDPTFAKVQEAFVAGVYDGWHFTGHGIAKDANPDRSSISLAENEAFTPEDVSGSAVNVGIPHPVVFINACQVGRGGLALTGIGGWARRFVQAGAGAFIGAYWSVYDEPAFAFAKEVYQRLLDGMPIGDAVREARLAVRADGDPTWMAYTVFADPLATVETIPA